MLLFQAWSRELHKIHSPKSEFKVMNFSTESLQDDTCGEAGSEPRGKMRRENDGPIPGIIMYCGGEMISEILPDRNFPATLRPSI